MIPIFVGCYFVSVDFHFVVGLCREYMIPNIFNLERRDLKGISNLILGSSLQQSKHCKNLEATNKHQLGSLRQYLFEHAILLKHTYALFILQQHE
jgi:hypothetical protein